MSSRLLWTLAGHYSHVWGSSFSLDEAYLATCSSDETVRVWQMSGRAAVVARLNSHDAVVRGCCFSPDSTLLASCSWDKEIHLYSTSDFKVRHKLQGHTYGVSCVRFSPCGHYLASCSWDDTVILWDVRTGTQLHQLRGHSSPVSACSFTVGGSALASCSWDGTVKLWDLSCLASPPITLQGHLDAVFDVSCSPTDSNVLATCGRKAAILIWDVRAGAPLVICEKSLKETNCVCFSPDGSQVATGNDLCEIHLWDMEHLKASECVPALGSMLLQGHSGSVTGLSYSPSGRLLASCSADHTCCVWSGCRTPTNAVTQLAESLASGLSFQSD